MTVFLFLPLSLTIFLVLLCVCMLCTKLWALKRKGEIGLCITFLALLSSVKEAAFLSHATLPSLPCGVFLSSAPFLIFPRIPSFG